MLNREKFAYLLDKYVQDTISAEERSELLAAISSGSYDDLLAQHIERNLQENNLESADLAAHRSAEILHKILSSEKQNARALPRIYRRVWLVRLASAAAVIALIITLVYLTRFSKNDVPASPIAYTADMNERANKSDHPQKIELEDGSIITLQPGSTIHYPLHFLPLKREVFLEGEAFFEVSKNAHRPFYVYNKNIVTHVLGTSFTVRVNKESQQVEVLVRSGRVEVYENNSAGKSSTGKKNNGVILLPNQKVIYDEHARQFFASLVDLPLPVITETEGKIPVAENMVFEETPLKTVLEYLEQSYGVEIVVENEALYQSLFTGDVTQQDLFARLDIICQSVQASYEVKGTSILIKWNKPN